MNPLTDDKTELFCDIPNLQPFDNVRWFKNGNPFEVQNQRIQMVDRNRKIQFSSVYPEDAGTYTCQSDEGKTYSVQLNPFPTGTADYFVNEIHLKNCFADALCATF